MKKHYLHSTSVSQVIDWYGCMLSTSREIGFEDRL